MSRFVVEVKGASAMNMLDINSISEDILIPLFSVIFGYTDLENLNRTERVNFPAIDLGDKKTKTAYQITSDPRSQKIKDTLAKFVKSELYKEYDRIKFYILTEKQKSYRVKFDDIIQDKFSFNVDNDILDYNDLLKEISGFPLAKLQEIEKILEDDFGERIHNTPSDIMDWIDYANKMSGSGQATSKINIQREKIRSDLFDFVLQENGVVIGSPGVGKTHLLNELHNHLQSNDIPHLLLSVDLLGNSDTNEWPDGLSFRGDLIEGLKSVPVSDNKAVLIFDGFDSARDDEKRKNLYVLFQRATQELNNWNIVVSVRTYDAAKSQELLELFGKTDDLAPTEYQTKGILCRHFTILPFTEDEILQALVQIGCQDTIYKNGSNEFKKILSNPFNLWLLEKILSFTSTKDIGHISQIRSEVQLFDRFWKQRVDSGTSERLLRIVSNQMVKESSLTVRMENVDHEVDLDNPARKSAWDKLQSDEILKKDSSTRQRIAFSHNILFDYAISVLLIDDEPKQLEEFITEDPSRPLFLRPSLTYFFTRLWYYEDAKYFWRAFWYILRSEQSVHLRLVARLIPTSVIANETQEIGQLKELIQRLQNRETIAEEAITRLFQALQTLEIKREKPWIDFCKQVSEYLHINFAWDLANLTSDILEKTKDSNVIDTCGQIGRRLLKWVWQERETKTDDWYNRFGGRWAVSLVAKTYHTDIDESRALLVKVLKLMQEDNFPIGFLTWLTDNVDNIFRHDSEFAIQIYFATFSHEFNSEGETRRGGSILPITTYRSQDFGMCQYRLVKHFRNFLEEEPIHATQAVVQSVNSFIENEYIFRFSKTKMTIEDLKEPFDFRKKTACFVKDDSHVWDARQSSDKPIEMVDVLFEFIAELADVEEKHSILDSLLDVFAEHVVAAFFWKRLLKTGSQFPKVFASPLSELCIAKPILLHLEVSYELGLFLKNAAYEFTSEQLSQIVERILALPIEAKDQENDEYLMMHRNKLLAQIPMELLSSDEAKSIRKKMEHENSVPENRPPVSFNTWSEPYTEEKWLKDKGVDTTTPENKKLQEYSQILEEFCRDWNKDNPTSEAIQSILPKMQTVYSIIENHTESNEIIDILWCKLTECASILAGIVNNLENDSFDFCRQIILEGANHELPSPDPQYDAQFDSMVYSPFPRHEAAKGLSLLAYHRSDEEVLDAIELLANDPVPSVRMLTAMGLRNVYVKNPDRFWKIIHQRSEFEENLVVQDCLYNVLNYIVAHRKENENQITTAMAKFLHRNPSPEMKIGTSDPFINLLLWLVIERENSWAIDFIKGTYFNAPIQYSNMLTRVVIKAVETYLDPKQFEVNKGIENVKRAIKFLNEVVSISINEIRELCNALNQNITEENQQKLQNTYRVIDQVISSFYYAFAHGRSQSENQTETLSDELKRRFYEEVKPIMEQVIDFADDPSTGVMFASTAHDFMQVLQVFLDCNAKEVLHFAERVARSSERFGYNLESLAVEDVVKLVEIVLADYRRELREDDDCLESLLNLLDLFAKTGWSDALKLVWRLDEVFR